MAALRFPCRVAERLLRAQFTSPSVTSVRATSLPLSSTWSARFYSESKKPPPPLPSPPLLKKVKGDLKEAIRWKRIGQLNTIRYILNQVQVASKTSKPITTDAELVAVLRRTRRNAAEVAAEFFAADRQDLASKEWEQIGFLDYYITESGLRELTEEQIREAVNDIVTGLTKYEKRKVEMREVMDCMLFPSGLLGGSQDIVDKAVLARVVKEALASQSV